MWDIKYICEHPGELTKALRLRGLLDDDGSLISEPERGIVALDEKHRRLLQERDEARAKRNAASREIAHLKRQVAVRQRWLHTLIIASLERGNHDPDEVLLHAAFQCLVDFMTKYNPESVDWTYDEEPQKVWEEIRALYEWWTNVRPARVDPLSDPTLDIPPLFPEGNDTSVERRKKYPRFYEALHQHTKLEKQWLEEDQANLHRLVEVRPYLWT